MSEASIKKENEVVQRHSGLVGVGEKFLVGPQWRSSAPRQPLSELEAEDHGDAPATRWKHGENTVKMTKLFVDGLNDTLSFSVAADISGTTGGPVELGAGSPQAGASDRRPERQAALKANHCVFIPLTRVHWSGSEGKVSGGRPLRRRNHHSWRGSALIPPQRPPVPRPLSKRQESEVPPTAVNVRPIRGPTCQHGLLQEKSCSLSHPGAWRGHFSAANIDPHAAISFKNVNDWEDVAFLYIYIIWFFLHCTGWLYEIPPLWDQWSSYLNY